MSDSQPQRCADAAAAPASDASDHLGCPTRPCARERREQVAGLAVVAGDEVVSAAQSVVSYYWNTAYDNHTACPEQAGGSDIFEQLRILARWLTSTH